MRRTKPSIPKKWEDEKLIRDGNNGEYFPVVFFHDASQPTGKISISNRCCENGSTEIKYSKNYEDFKNLVLLSTTGTNLDLIYCPAKPDGNCFYYCITKLTGLGIEQYQFIKEAITEKAIIDRSVFLERPEYLFYVTSNDEGAIQRVTDLSTSLGRLWDDAKAMTSFLSVDGKGYFLLN